MQGQKLTFQKTGGVSSLFNNMTQIEKIVVSFVGGNYNASCFKTKSQTAYSLYTSTYNLESRAQIVITPQAIPDPNAPTVVDI